MTNEEEIPTADPRSIPSSVKKAGAEARKAEAEATIAEREADREPLLDDLRDLVETWRHEAAGTSSKRSDGLAQASDELQEVIERHE